jgi:hypothetical protein
MNANTQQSENKIIDINNMRDEIALLDLGPPELQATIRTVAPVEEIVADLSAASLFEEQDDTMFALKHTQEPVALYSNEDEEADNHKIPRKRVKTFHEHPIPEPMDICTSKGSEKWMYSCCANCVLSDGQMPSQYCRRAYPDRIIERYSDDSDEEREIDEYDPRRVFKKTSIKKKEVVEEVDDCGHGVPYGVCYDCIWFLEEESKRLYPRRRRPQQLEEVAVRLFEDEPEQEDHMPVLSMPRLQRQNTQFPVNGVTVYNGNPNGSRLFDCDEDLI